jgi:hypothetical protein
VNNLSETLARHESSSEHHPVSAPYVWVLRRQSCIRMHHKSMVALSGNPLPTYNIAAPMHGGISTRPPAAPPL